MDLESSIREATAVNYRWRSVMKQMCLTVAMVLMWCWTTAFAIVDGPVDTIEGPDVPLPICQGSVSLVCVNLR
jgi:hypothetical protein